MRHYKILFTLFVLILALLSITPALAEEATPSEDQLIYAAMPCDTWFSMGNFAPPWCFSLDEEAKSAAINDCQLNVRSFAAFTPLDGNNPNTSRIGEITVLGSIRPCNYNFFFRYTGTIDFFYADGAVKCSAIDQGTAHCVGFIDTNILIGFADTLDGQYPKTARVQGEGVTEVVWEFRGRQLLVPILIRQ